MQGAEKSRLIGPRMGRATSSQRPLRVGGDTTEKALARGNMEPTVVRLSAYGTPEAALQIGDAIGTGHARQTTNEMRRRTATYGEDLTLSRTAIDGRELRAVGCLQALQSGTDADSLGRPDCW